MQHFLLNPRTLIQLAMVEKFRDTHAFIMAGGDVVVSRLFTRKHDKDELITSFGPTPIQQHLLKNDIEGCTKFYMYSPELIAAYLNHPVMNGFIAGHQSIYSAFTAVPEWQHAGNWWYAFNLFVKPLMYAEQFPEMLHRQKYHGFENAEQLADIGRRMIEGVERAHGFKDQSNKIIMPVAELRDHVLNGGGAERVWTANLQEAIRPKPSAALVSFLKSDVFKRPE